MKKITARQIQELKGVRKISALTAYDYSGAKYFDRAGVDVLLVGDSLAQVILGYESTLQVSLDEMKIFAGAVIRGAQNALVVVDMPFLSYHTDIPSAMQNAGEIMRTGAGAVKIEGASKYILEVVKHLSACGVPIMGHLGFTPQYVKTIGGHFVAGKNFDTTLKILEDARALQAAGAFAVVLEMVPKESAKFISERLDIPTIGIGAGPECDGQILVGEDILGRYENFCPKFARQYANLKENIYNAAKAWREDVENGSFPSAAESFGLDEEEIKKLENFKDN
jgi:3-methyl-2-oxobutanoate hydroxymethyltransferase